MFDQVIADRPVPVVVELPPAEDDENMTVRQLITHST